MALNITEFRRLVREALQEDLGFGDISSGFFPRNEYSKGTFTAKTEGILAGMDVISEAYAQLGDDIQATLLKQDGEAVTEGETIAEAEGPVAQLLAGERVILNLIQHMSGIATATNRAVTALGRSDTRICDTRKTLPGLRMIQKYAVRCGGGFNHRYRLDDGVMIKDNHIRAAGSITKAVERIRNEIGPMVRIEVETESTEQVLEAVETGTDVIMFDNRTPEEVRKLVSLVPDHIITEVSGGITPETAGKYSDTGVDFISIGSLTHSVKALDISFNLE